VPHSIHLCGDRANSLKDRGASIDQIGLFSSKGPIMNARLSLALAAALTSLTSLCASADFTVTPFGDHRFRPIHEGLAAEQVTDMVGKPTAVEMRGGEKHWIYTYTDSWGNKAIYDVAFDAGGHVERTSSMRISF
jgi:outer membrane protein assembly factor BamE (lipoprotein component of BamABCDE complex)